MPALTAPPPVPKYNLVWAESWSCIEGEPDGTVTDPHIYCVGEHTAAELPDAIREAHAWARGQGLSGRTFVLDGEGNRVGVRTAAEESAAAAACR